MGSDTLCSEVDKSCPYRSEGLGSNPVHCKLVFISFFIYTTSPGRECPKLTIIVNSKQIINDNR